MFPSRNCVPAPAFVVSNCIGGIRMSSDSVQELLIPAERLADMMNVSTRTLWRLLSAKKLLEPVRIGGSVRWRLEEIKQWIADGCPPQGT
jgi:predicted DNA-binding transcriptional regulator AlpA